MLLLVIALIYLVSLNITAFILCGVDKSRAKKGQWRISERALLLIGFFGGAFGVALGMAAFWHKTRRPKFRILVPLACALWAVVAIHMASAFTLDRQIQYLEISYPSAAVPQTLDGYTIAFVTDTHALPAEDLCEVVNRINAFAPDLLVLGGDFPSQGNAPQRSMEILAGVQATDGIYGVEGNHDDYRKLFTAMKQYGITPLSNSGVAIRDCFYLAGVEDLWNRSPDIAMATKDASEEDFVLLLAHNPDVSMRQSTGTVDLILSGHTHGGYINFFGVFAPALSWLNDVTDYGQRFMSGWAKSRDGTDVFVSNGTGYFAHAPRFFARPQVIILTLAHETA